jgi:hypothetical protein
MRIAVEDFQQELYDAEYVEAETEYRPGHKPAPAPATRKTAKEIVDLVEEKPVVNKLVDNTQHMKLGMDFSLGKFFVIMAMFFIMFVLPVGVYDGWLNPANIAPREVYTSDALEREGRVAGASTQNMVQNTSSSFSSRKIMGLSMGLIFIILGFSLIAIPTIILLR